MLVAPRRWIHQIHYFLRDALTVLYLCKLYKSLTFSGQKLKCILMVMYCGALMGVDSKTIETVLRCIPTFCDVLWRVGGWRAGPLADN